MWRARSVRSVFVLISVFLFICSTGCGEDKDKGLSKEDLSKAVPSDSFKVERVIDGDTIVLEDGRTVRYIGINTPERGEPYYEEAKEANRHLVQGQNVRLELDEEEKDRYGRTLAYVYVGDIFVNVELVRMGCARAYPYPPNTKYEALILRAQNEARQKRLGIWSSRPRISGVEIAEVHYDALGDDKANLNGEWVLIVNNTDSPVNMDGFTLSDDSHHVYNFEDFTLPAGGSVKVFTGSGDDTSKSLYWNSKAPIWNNDGDTVYLKDNYGSLVDEYPY